jgi:hypothetical protein
LGGRSFGVLRGNFYHRTRSSECERTRNSTFEQKDHSQKFMIGCQSSDPTYGGE